MIAAPFPVLTFHALDDQSLVTSFSPGVFQHGIARLHENGYRALSLLEAVDCLRRGEPLPNRSFTITFDDGYHSVYCEALPVLQQYGMSATVFLTVGETRRVTATSRLPSLSGRSMLSWGEIREMQRWGIVFGAHTLTHPDLTCLPIDRIEAEVYASKAMIEDILSTPAVCFAYPYGRYDDRSRSIVQQYFACACSDKLGLVTTGSDLYALERVDAYYLRTDRLFAVMRTKLFPWYIQARAFFRGLRRTV